jgi:chemotaxis signal transduction protein
MTSETQHRIALRLRLDSGAWSIPLHRVHFVTGYATLTGQPDMYFLGWLLFHGQQVPVFDLNQVVCEQPTPEHFGSRILLIEAGANPAIPYLGLLASGVTDTVAGNDANTPTLDLDSSLPMLLTMIPPLPSEDVIA